MITTEFTYLSTNTSTQVIDTFDPAAVLSLNYRIQVSTANDTSISYLDVVHNGISTTDYQIGTALSNTRPIPMFTDIQSFIGDLKVTPKAGNTIFTVTRNANPTNVYGENVASGKILPSNTGVGISFASPASMIVRQENNNQYMTVGSSVGPTTTLSELIMDWTAVNGSRWDGNTIVSSSIAGNYQYVEIPVEDGKVYTLDANCYIIEAQSQTNIVGPYSSSGNPTITIGDTIGSSEYLYFLPDIASTQKTTNFSSTSNSVYVAIGNGALDSKIIIDSISVKECVPFDTFNQYEGTIVLKWSAIAADSTVLNLTSLDSLYHKVTVDSSNNIIIYNGSNIVNCAAQHTTNKLAFSYSNTGISASVNGADVVSGSFDTINKIITASFESNHISEFVYIPSSNTNIVELSA